MGESLKRIRADLHVHTVVSPCASVEMIPPLIVRHAVNEGINWIAITDHNSTANIEAVIRAAKGSDLAVIPGVELQTLEEVHVLALFDTLDQARQIQRIIDNHLPGLANNIDFFGEQFIVDHTGEFIAREDRMLISSLTLGFSELSRIIPDLGGVFIPAHVNRKSNGLFQTLGFISPDDKIDALEISRHISVEDCHLTYPQTRDYPVIQNGDVHNLDDFLGNTFFHVSEPSVLELRKALKNLDGRTFEVVNSN